MGADLVRSPGEDSAGADIADLVRAMWLATAEGSRARGDLVKQSGSTVGALQFLIAADGMTPTALAAAMRLPRPRVSDLITKLLAEGLVERIPSTKDRRSVLLVASPRGREIIDTFRRGRYGIVEDALVDLSADEQAIILAALPALERLCARMEAAAVDAGAGHRAAEGSTRPAA